MIPKSFFQYLAPIVLGIISVITKIKIVKIADTIPKDVSPKILIDSAPTLHQLYEQLYLKIRLLIMDDQCLILI